MIIIKDSYKKIKALLVLVLCLGACDSDLDEINTDPTKFNEIDEGFQFAWVINRMVSERFEQWRGNMIYNSLWVQHFSGSWGPDRYDDRDETFLSAQWDRTYVDYLKNMNDVIERTEENSNKNLIARVMKVFFMQRLTDMHGDIPYSEAGKDLTNSTPIYDTQEAIYRDFVSELTNAAQNLNSAADEVDNFGPQDPIYNGDIDKWKKFANSLLLRVGMRMSDVDPIAAEAAVRTALEGGVFNTNEDIAYIDFLAASSIGPRNGLSSIFQENGLLGHGFSYSELFVETLKSQNDPRIPIFMARYEGTNDDFKEVPTAPIDFKGRQNGVLTPLDLEDAQPTRTIMVPFTAPVLLMTYAEVAFLKAEAALLGWASGFTSEDEYENGIKAACRHLALYPNTDGVSESDLEAFLEEPNVIYNSENAKEQIITQKWIALVFNGYEAFAEYRRTGFPVLNTVQNSLLPNGVEPTRMRYPILESSLNIENYNEAIGRIGGSDDITAKVWWDK